MCAPAPKPAAVRPHRRVALGGTYGSLTLNGDGSFTYVIDEANAAVQALRATGQTVSESFT